MIQKFTCFLILGALATINLFSQSCPTGGDCSYTISTYNATGYGCNGELYVNYNYECPTTGIVFGTDYLGNEYSNSASMIYPWGWWELLPGAYSVQIISVGIDGLSCLSPVTSFEISQPASCDFDLQYEINEIPGICENAQIKIWSNNQGCTNNRYEYFYCISYYLNGLPIGESQNHDTITIEIPRGIPHTITAQNCIGTCSEELNITAPTLGCEYSASVTPINTTTVGGCLNGKIKVNLTGMFNCYPHLQLFNIGGFLISDVSLTLGTSQHTFTNLFSGKYTVKIYDGGSFLCEQLISAQVKCPKPSSGFETISITSNSAKIKWNSEGCAEAYKIQYRPAGTPTWINQNSTLNNKKLTGLSPNTTYEWKVASQCVDSEPIVYSQYSALQTFTTLPLKTGQFSIDYEVEVYPNPASSIMNIETNLPVENATIRILNVNGQIFKLFKYEFINEATLSIDISELKAGMYYIEIITNSEIRTKQFIKQ